MTGFEYYYLIPSGSEQDGQRRIRFKVFIPQTYDYDLPMRYYEGLEDMLSKLNIALIGKDAAREGEGTFIRLREKPQLGIKTDDGMIGGIVLMVNAEYASAKHDEILALLNTSQMQQTVRI